MDLLCLKCRGTGHSANTCHSNVWLGSTKWVFSQQRKLTKLPTRSDVSRASVCHRCRGLRLIQLLQGDVPWQTRSDLEAAAATGHKSIRKLGKTGNVQFHMDCTVCWALWSLTPNPSSEAQEILLFPDWTSNRLTGGLGLHMEREEKRQYAKCIIIGLAPDPSREGLWERANSNDALCIVGNDNSPPLSGRHILAGGFNISVATEWISACVRLHGDLCDPVSSPELQTIRLIDVDARRIVSYSEKMRVYVALSYVWGDCEQPSFPLGASLPRLPATIEDAMQITSYLGIQYLWVDSVCIEQNDKIQKLDQISKMWAIYRGAYLTVVALSGESADAGLQIIRKGATCQPQIACSIDDVHLVGLMPTLEFQIWQGPWGTRAWTLQEAILSHRCLYVSDHQLYFECEAMQCCESLDQRRSWAHNLDRAHGTDKAKWQTWVMNEVGSGCLRNPLDSPENRIVHWGAKVALYCYRAMSRDKDALYAFGGILQRLGELYSKGFFWGIPVEDLQWGLLWFPQTFSPVRRSRFPSWSWAGWKGPIWLSLPQDRARPHQYPVHLRAWKIHSHSFVDLFDAGREALFDDIEGSHDIEDLDLCFSSALPNLGEPGNRSLLLLMTVIGLSLLLDFSRPRPDIDRRGTRLFETKINGVVCFINIMATDPLVTESKATSHGKDLFLLVARDVAQIAGYDSNFILVVRYRRDMQVWERETVFQLLIPSDKIDILGSLQPKKHRLVLA